MSAILLAGGTTGDADRGAADRGERRTMPAKTIEETLRDHTDALMAIPGVVGVAQGLRGGKACIRVFVVEKTPQLEQRIPRDLDGYPIVVEATGEIRALPKER
jgi:hypothetical protein